MFIAKNYVSWASKCPLGSLRGAVKEGSRQTLGRGARQRGVG